MSNDAVENAMFSFQPLFSEGDMTENKRKEYRSGDKMSRSFDFEMMPLSLMSEGIMLGIVAGVAVKLLNMGAKGAYDNKVYLLLFALVIFFVAFYLLFDDWTKFISSVSSSSDKKTSAVERTGINPVYVASGGAISLLLFGILYVTQPKDVRMSFAGQLAVGAMAAFLYQFNWNLGAKNATMYLAVVEATTVAIANIL